MALTCPFTLTSISLRGFSGSGISQPATTKGERTRANHLVGGWSIAKITLSVCMSFPYNPQRVTNLIGQRAPQTVCLARHLRAHIPDNAQQRRGAAAGTIDTTRPVAPAQTAIARGARPGKDLLRSIARLPP